MIANEIIISYLSYIRVQIANIKLRSYSESRVQNKLRKKMQERMEEKTFIK
jgi:hypothetical protein